MLLYTCLLASFRGTADWFGVSKDSDATQKWQRKSLRHCSLRYGKLKPQVIREMDLPSQDNISLTSTETPPPLYVGPCQLGMQKVSTLGQRQGYSEFPAQCLCHFGSRDLSVGLSCACHVSEIHAQTLLRSQIWFGRLPPSAASLQSHWLRSLSYLGDRLSSVCPVVTAVLIRSVQHVQELSAQAFSCHFARTKFCCMWSGILGPLKGLVSLRKRALVLVPGRMLIYCPHRNWFYFRTSKSCSRGSSEMVLSASEALTALKCDPRGQAPVKRSSWQHFRADPPCPSSSLCSLQ